MARILPIEQESCFLVDDALAAECAECRPQLTQDYHDFLRAFSKRKCTSLPPQRPNDHHIDLLDHTTPPYGPIYSLSEVE